MNSPNFLETSQLNKVVHNYNNWEVMQRKVDCHFKQKDIKTPDAIFEAEITSETKLIILEKSLNTIDQLYSYISKIKKNSPSDEQVIIIGPDGSMQGPDIGNSCILKIDGIIVVILEHHNNDREIEPSATKQYEKLIKSLQDEGDISTGSKGFRNPQNITKNELRKAFIYHKKLFVLDSRIDPDSVMPLNQWIITAIQTNKDNIRDSKIFNELKKRFVLYDKNSNEYYHQSFLDFLNEEMDQTKTKIFNKRLSQIIEIISEVDKSGGIFPASENVSLDRIYHEINFLQCRESLQRTPSFANLVDSVALAIYRAFVPLKIKSEMKNQKYKPLTIDSLYTHPETLDRYFPAPVIKIIGSIPRERLSNPNSQPIEKLEYFYPKKKIVVYTKSTLLDEENVQEDELEDEYVQYSNRILIIDGKKSDVNYRESLPPGVRVNVTLSHDGYIAVAATKTPPLIIENSNFYREEQDLSIEIKLNKILKSLFIRFFNRVSNWHYNFANYSLDSLDFNQGIAPLEGSLSGNKDTQKNNTFYTLELLAKAVNFIADCILPWFDMIDKKVVSIQDLQDKHSYLDSIIPDKLSKQIWDLAFLKDGLSKDSKFSKFFEELHECYTTTKNTL